MALATSPLSLAIAAERTSPAKLKNPPPWLHPRQLERSYAALLQKMARDFARQVREIVLPALPAIEEQANAEQGRADGERTDAWSDRVSQLLGILRLSTAERDNTVSALAVDIGQKTSNWNDKEWQKILRRTVGVGLLTSEPGLRDRLKLFSTTNKNWFKGMQESELAKLEGIIERGFSTGARHETVAKEIREQLGKTENRARLTARDQVSKLNGRLTQMRQEEAGISKYIWQTAQDGDRVRPNHRVMQGKLGRWDNASLYATVEQPNKWRARSGINAVELHPGQDILCRCYPEPFIRELQEEAA